MIAWLCSFIPDPWPNARPLPPHVVAVRIDPKMLSKHLIEASKGPLKRTSSKAFIVTGTPKK